MSLINEKVIEEFSTWAEENENRHIFPEISNAEDSYYINRDTEETYMMEYSFKTLPELKSALEQYSGLSSDPQMLKKLTVEICQDRFRSKLDTNGNKDNISPNTKVSEGKQTLPEYVYVF